MLLGKNCNTSLDSEQTFCHTCGNRVERTENTINKVVFSGNKTELAMQTETSPQLNPSVETEPIFQQESAKSESDESESSGKRL